MPSLTDGARYVILNEETAPDVLARPRTSLSPGEILGWATPDLFDES